MNLDICIHDKDCGGCIYQGIPYQEQLEAKLKTVREFLKEERIAPELCAGIQGSASQYAYRNKMEYTFGDEVKGGEMNLGMHKAGRFMSIITVDHCRIVHPDYNLVLRAALDFCREKGYSFYHKKSHTGLMRNLVLRSGIRTNELLINIITSSQGEFDEAGFLELMHSLPLEETVVGVLHTVNDQVGDGVNCDELRILEGRDYYREEILGLKFKVSAFSFFQTNIESVERLYTEALSLAENPEGKTVFDLYCGTGTITQALALQAKETIGVEIVEEAVEAARINAEENGLKNCRFIAGDVLNVLDTLEEKPDLIVVDPPRAGIHPKAWQKILAYGVKQIVYISCNPKSLAQNLGQAAWADYEVKSIKAYDNFPFTKHIECTALLQLK